MLKVKDGILSIPQHGRLTVLKLVTNTVDLSVGSHGGINASLMYLGSAIAEGQILQHVESVYGRLSSTLATGVSAFQTARCRFIDPAHLFYPRVSKEHRRRGARSRRNWRHFSLLESGSKNEASGSVVRQFRLFCRGWKTGGLDGAWYILCTL